MGAMDRPQAWRELLSVTTSDSLSGAKGISGGAASVLIAYSQQASPASLAELADDLRVISRSLLGAQPAMASVVNLLNGMWYALDRQSAVGPALAVVRETARAFVRRMEEAGRRVAKQAAAVFPSDACVMTISASATVAGALLYARRDGRRLRVICLESRPMLEGRALAAQLAEADIAVTLVVDAAAYDSVREVDVLLVGADSLAPNGLVSKIGTAGLALAARTLRVPAYVLADRSKIWPAQLGMPVIRQRVGDEVWLEPPEGVQARNRYFDVADWTAFQGVISEGGILTSEEVLSEGQAMRVHAELAKLYGAV